MSKLAVVAIGGNALLIEGQKGTIAEQIENALDMARQLAKMIKLGWRVIVTHGNGPQVGFIVLRSDRSADVLPRLPLDICVADSQGGIGYIIVDALQTAMTELGLEATATAVVWALSSRMRPPIWWAWTLMTAGTPPAAASPPLALKWSSALTEPT